MSFHDLSPPPFLRRRPSSSRSSSLTSLALSLSRRCFSRLALPGSFLFPRSVSLPLRPEANSFFLFSSAWRKVGSLLILARRSDYVPLKVQLLPSTEVSIFLSLCLCQKRARRAERVASSFQPSLPLRSAVETESSMLLKSLSTHGHQLLSTTSMES